jgi:hypothetical protein
MFAYCTSEPFELTFYPLCTEVGFLGAKQTGTKTALLLYIKESTVGNELGT